MITIWIIFNRSTIFCNMQMHSKYHFPLCNINKVFRIWFTSTAANFAITSVIVAPFWVASNCGYNRFHLLGTLTTTIELSVRGSIHTVPYGKNNQSANVYLHSIPTASFSRRCSTTNHKIVILWPQIRVNVFLSSIFLFVIWLCLCCGEG